MLLCCKNIAVPRNCHSRKTTANSKQGYVADELTEKGENVKISVDTGRTVYPIDGDVDAQLLCMI